MNLIELEEKFNIIITLDDNLFYVYGRNGELLFLAPSVKEIEKGMIELSRM